MDIGRFARRLALLALAAIALHLLGRLVPNLVLVPWVAAALAIGYAFLTFQSGGVRSELGERGHYRGALDDATAERLARERGRNERQALGAALFGSALMILQILAP